MKKKTKTDRFSKARNWAKSSGSKLILDGSGYDPKGVKKWAVLTNGSRGTRDVSLYEKINGKKTLIGFREFADQKEPKGGLRGKGESPKTQRKKYLSKKKK